jgi:adenosylhomocysteine nucleosidase
MVTPDRVVGIMGAMPEEIDDMIPLIKNHRQIQMGGRTYHLGTIHQTHVVLVFSRWGKVAAATTAATLILSFRITELIFTGVAGAIHPHLHVGDMVIGKKCYQHDMDARPLMKQFEIPLTGMTFFECDSEHTMRAYKVAEMVLKPQHLKALFSSEHLAPFGILHPKVLIGDLASGDTFFSTSKDKQHLMGLLPEVVCVEMEGAAVAQVCFDYEIPFSIVRIISDTADESAPIDFPLFIQNISGKLSAAFINHLLNTSLSEVFFTR